MPAEAKEEGLRVARLLLRWIEDRGFSITQVEEKVGWGQKTLWEVLQGNQPVRISHIAAVAGAVGFELRDFYLALADAPVPAPKSRRQPKPVAPGLSEEEMFRAFRAFLVKWKAEGE